MNGNNHVMFVQDDYQSGPLMHVQQVQGHVPLMAPYGFAANISSCSPNNIMENKETPMTFFQNSNSSAPASPNTARPMPTFEWHGHQPMCAQERELGRPCPCCLRHHNIHMVLTQQMRSFEYHMQYTLLEAEVTLFRKLQAIVTVFRGNFLSPSM